jgi:hypothetical protein
LIGHAEMAEREVVFHRVVRIQFAKRRRDVGRHLPPGAGVTRQTQAAPHPDDVRVEGHDELRRRHVLPDAEVHRVAANHPSQKQVQPLAGAST